MCLMTRREPCLACWNINECKILQERYDDDMLDETISEGIYLKVMNQLKEMYDEANSYHQKCGCDDCEEEKEEAESEDEELEVEHFYWRGTDYYIDADAAVGLRRLWDPNTEEVVGHVDSTGLVHIY
jgi:hypothetical protein